MFDIRPLPPRRTLLLTAAGIFLLSFCIRSLHAVDLENITHTRAQIFYMLTLGYDHRADSILAGDGILFVRVEDQSDTTLVSQAPGYPIFLAGVYALFGKNYYWVQLIQNLIESLSPVLLFATATLVIGWRVGTTAGILSAVSHHFCYFSNLVLPDSLSTLPIIAAVFLVTGTGPRRMPPMWRFIGAGALIGLSCWLRPNALLLPFFVAGFLTLLAVNRAQSVRRGLALIAAALVVIAPVTIRNYVSYGDFVPVRIGLGIVLWQGIGESSDRFDAPVTDGEVARLEAEIYGEPRYAESWNSPDGIRRDRDRVARSLEIIRTNPGWYLLVMLGRMREMLKYSAHAPLVRRPGDIESAGEQSAGSPSIDRGPLLVGNILSPLLRIPARLAQRATKEVALPFVIIGIVLLALVSWRRAVFLLMVPCYFLLAQSSVHTEFRYVLAMHFFLFAFAGITWLVLFQAIVSAFTRLRTLAVSGQ